MIGPQDVLDARLVQKYANLKVNNLDGVVSKPTLVDPEKMMSAMNDYALVSRNAFIISDKIKDFCSQINTNAAIACHRA